MYNDMRSEFAAQSPAVSTASAEGQVAENVVEMPRHATGADMVAAETTRHLAGVTSGILGLSTLVAKHGPLNPRDPAVRDLWVSTVMSFEQGKMPMNALNQIMDVFCTIGGMHKAVFQAEMIRALQAERAKGCAPAAPAVKAP